MTKKELCMMCDEYSFIDKCEHEDKCKLLALLKENEELKKNLADLRLRMSYMHDPNSIGDSHEMGSW